MIGVAEQDLTAHLPQVSRQHRFDGSLRSDRHEARRFDSAVGRHEATKAGIGIGIFSDDGEMTGHCSILDSYSVQSENLFLTYSCRQKVDDFLNGVISFAI